MKLNTWSFRLGSENESRLTDSLMMQIQMQTFEYWCNARSVWTSRLSSPLRPQVLSAGQTGELHPAADPPEPLLRLPGEVPLQSRRAASPHGWRSRDEAARFVHLGPAAVRPRLFHVFMVQHALLSTRGLLIMWSLLLHPYKLTGVQVSVVILSSGITSPRMRTTPSCVRYLTVTTLKVMRRITARTSRWSQRTCPTSEPWDRPASSTSCWRTEARTTDRQQSEDVFLFSSGHFFTRSLNVHFKTLLAINVHSVNKEDARHKAW